MAQTILTGCWVFCGCGTASLAVLRQLLREAAVYPAFLVLCDHDSVEPHNAVSCPEYAGQEGAPKAEVLGRLARQWLGGRPTAVVVQQGLVEELDWPQLLHLGQGGTVPAIVITGLDDWQSRLNVVQDVRGAVGGRPGRAFLLQVGLERGQGQVSIFGTAWGDPCPACGLAELPHSEPCILRSAAGGFVRGDLRCEAAATAGLVRRAVVGICGSATTRREWLNTKSNLCLHDDHNWRITTRRRAMHPGCLGAHHAQGPLPWSALAGGHSPTPRKEVADVGT